MRRVLGSVLALGCVCWSAACGGSDLQTVQVEATPEFLAASAERTAEETTGRFETQMVQRIEVVGERVTTETTTVGEYDAEAELVAGDQHQVIEGPAFDDEGDGEVVQDDTAIYFRGFPFTEVPFSAQPDEWLVIEVPEEVLAISGATSETGAVVSPAEHLDLLLESLDDVEEQGREEVRGVETTHLTASYDLPQAALDAFEDLAPGIDPPADMPIDAWIDDQGLVRRIETGNEIDGVTTSVTVEYFDFGVAVEIDVPSDATPLEDLVPAAGAGALEGAADEAQAELEAAEEALAEAEAQAEAALDALPPDMRAIAEAMAELTPEQLADDPCQVVEDPALREECELFLPSFGG